MVSGSRADPRVRLAQLGLLLSALCFCFAVVATGRDLLMNSLLGEVATQKLISLRMRLAEYLPQAKLPEYVPTPFTEPLLLPDYDDHVEPVGETPTPESFAGPDQTLGMPTPLSAPTRPPAVPTRTPTRVPTRAPAAGVSVSRIKPEAALSGFKHDYQKWNNCAPTTLAINLSYFGRAENQLQIAAATKPNPEDKNVRPDELAAYVAGTGLRSITRVDGTLDRLKLLVSNGLPTIVETAYVKQPQGWMGHYRLVVGYDEAVFVSMDSYDGPNTRIPAATLDSEWQAFNRLYLVVYRPDQESLVRALLADTLDDAAMYQGAVETARAEMSANPRDAFAHFNLGTSLLALKRYREAAAAFDQARVIGLPWRMLWYQFGPYEAYLQAGRYQEALSLAEATLKVTDDIEEAHYYRGRALRAMGRIAEARQAFERALRYNKNYAEAQRALTLLSN